MSDDRETHLAQYAIRSADHAGRGHPEPEDQLRNPFELDRHRIIESTAFRRLERKTQVFTSSYHDHFRTRLTHTLEVAQIARTLAVGLGANEVLSEVVALAHDLGHPPFGHAGEAALGEAMADHGGFNHNTHSLRVVDYLEHPFPQFRGLNLTLATRRELALHETRYDRPDESPGGFEGVAGGSGVEGLIASMADRLAVVRSDLEDAIGAELIGLGELENVALWREAANSLLDLEHSSFVDDGRRAKHIDSETPPDGRDKLKIALTKGKNIHVIRRPVLDTMLDRILLSVVQTSRVALTPMRSTDEVRESRESVVTMPGEVSANLDELERLLFERLYRGPEIVRMDADGRKKVLALFAVYRQDPNKLPPRFAGRIERQGIGSVIRDYIAGMTDRFCEAAYQRLCQP